MSCDFNNCKLKKVNIIGVCNYCHYTFCLKHRLPETHQCKQIENVKKQASELLYKKLVEEANSSRKKLV